MRRYQKATSALLAFVLAITSLVVSAGTASADTPQAVVGMPFTGKWAYNAHVNPPYTDSNSSHPSVHHTPGGGDWGTDIYAPEGTAVKLHVPYANGSLSFGRVASSTSCGQSLRVVVYVNGAATGWIYFAHLNNVPSGAITNGMTVGTMKNWGCNPGTHAHVEFKNLAGNHSCYVDHGSPGVSVGEGTNFGVLGSGNAGVRQACSSVPSSPPSSPVPDKTVVTSQVANGNIQRVYTGMMSGKLYESWWAPGYAQWHTTQIADFGYRVTAITSQLTADGIQHVYASDSTGALHEVYLAPGIGWVSHIVGVVGGITTLSSQVTPDGTQHIYSGTDAGRVFETWWNPTSAWSTSQIADFANGVKGLSSQLTSDGGQHIYGIDTSGAVHEVYLAATGWSDNIIGVTSGATSISSQVVGTTQRVYVGSASGKVNESWWAPGQSQWNTAQIADFANEVVGLSTQWTPDNVQHVYGADASGAVHEVYLVPGVGWNHHIVGVVSGVSAVSSQLTGGDQHIYSATGSGAVYETWWSPTQGWGTGLIKS